MKRKDKIRILKALTDEGRSIDSVAYGGGYVFYIRLLELMSNKETFSDCFEPYERDSVEECAMERLADCGVNTACILAGEQLLFDIQDDVVEVSVPPEGYDIRESDGYIIDEVASVMPYSSGELKEKISGSASRSEFKEFLAQELYEALEMVYPERYGFINSPNLDTMIKFAEWWCACQVDVSEEDWALSMNTVLNITSKPVDEWLNYLVEENVDEEDRKRSSNILFDVVTSFDKYIQGDLDGITYESIDNERMFFTGTKDIGFQLMSHSAWEPSAYAYTSYACLSMGMYDPHFLLSMMVATEFLEEMESKYHFRKAGADGKQ